MLIKFEHREDYYCDACKEKIEECISELCIKIDYGTEDECWGSHGAEDKLYSISRKLQETNPDDLDELQSALREYSLQNIVHICDECRNYKTDNFVNKFVNKIRDNRAQVLIELVKTKEIPELLENANDVAIKELEERAKKIISDIQGKELTDWALEEKMTIYSNIQIKLRELRQ